MVFESLISPLKAEKYPWEMMFFGFLYASIGMALGLWVFKAYAGLVAVFFTVMVSIPLVYSTALIEEEKIEYIEEERSLLKEHGKALLFFVFMFVGMTLAFTTWYVVMPLPVSQSIFSIQTNTILDINSNVGSINLFGKIFFNNLKVLTFCLLFSFFFGAGAIFILTWNASVIAVAMGSIIKSYLFTATGNIVLAHITGYSNAMLRYFIHGIPEITAYFIAALAGGIISTAIVRKDVRTKNFQRIAFDTSNLIILSIVVLVIAGLLETYVTPLFY